MEKLIEKLIHTCSEYLQEQFKWQTGMKEELKRLQENHPKIQAVLSAARQAQKIDPDSAINKWIWQLRDAIDEADDVLDDFEYMKHEEQLLDENMEETGKRSICSFPFETAKKFLRVGESALKIGKRAVKNDPMLKRLEEVVHKLDQISAEVNTFLHLLIDTKQEQQVQQEKLENYRETGSMPTDVLIGRDQDKESVIQWLGKLPNEEHQSHVSNIPNYDNISVLSVVGPGGMGKTTLLQHVYEDESTNVFDPKMWVCVSNNFDCKKVLIDMLESPQNTTLDALQKSLKSKVMSKKFLLVLDDIWEEDEVRDKIKWEKVLAPLAYGGLGSKILITTRMKSVASMIEKVIKKVNESLMIKGLDDDECLHLLNTHAFAGVKNLNDHKKLESITKEFVKKLYGSPLAAKVLGGALNSKLDERHWRIMLNNILSLNDISSILKLSYIFLPEYLQTCFAFCRIFAQDHVFDKHDLVRMWIAMGFIQPSCIREQTLEDIGEKYFDMLVKKSFFDKFDEVYKMHDLLHELAQSVSKQECFRIVGDEDSDLKIPETIRHLSIKTSNLVLLKKMKFKNLRTLCITYNSDNQDLVDVLTKCFEENRSIRLLSIYADEQKIIPEKIGSLKHLRYLRLDFSHDSLLPRSVCNLYHLQFLICKYSTAWFDDFFTRNMNKLSNLRYLKSPYFKIHGIGNLKFLQELDWFEVKNEGGYKIRELEHMNDLGILRIRGLEKVLGVQEAYEAKLCDKRKLTDLSLKWDSSWWKTEDNEDCAKILDNLQPHNHLTKLTMMGYLGERSAIWMNNVDMINNLEHIDLEECLEWLILPPFGQLPFLKSLRLHNMPRAVRFGVDCLFPCLTKLELYNCPNLQELPYLPPKLEELKAKKIGWKTLNCSCNILGHFGTFLVRGCPNISTINVKWKIIDRAGVLKNVELEDCPNLLSIGGHQEAKTTENCVNLIVDELKISDASVLQMEPMRSITSIRKLTIEDNDGPASVQFEAERWFLQVSSSLRELYFNYLNSLQSLPSTLTSLSSLEILHLENIPLLKSLQDLPPSLSSLKLERLKNLNCLPYCLPTLSSLTSLFIHNIPHLRELSGLPPSLCELYLGNLDNLNCLPSGLPTLYSLAKLHIESVPQLQELPDLPPSLANINLSGLDNLNCLPSCLPTLSSLSKLKINNVPQLQELPGLPPLCELDLRHLDKLNCLPSCLPTLSSLAKLHIEIVPQLRELPDLPLSLANINLSDLNNLNCLPSCLPSLASLTSLSIWRAPRLQELPDLPPSLRELELQGLDNLNCLPSCLPTLSFLKYLYISRAPQLRELPDLPSSLCNLSLYDLDNLKCLPSCLPTLSSLTSLSIKNVPLLRELPDLPPSLKYPHIYQCDPEFMQRYGQ